MSTTDHSRPGSAGGADEAGQLHGGPDDDYTPEQLAAMDRTELDRLGARYDGVEVLHVEPVAPPGSPLDKKNTRQVTLWFALAALFALAFVVVYAGSGWFLPSWEWRVGSSTWSALYTPLLGALFGLSMICIGIGLVMYVKKLLPHETAVQDKHDGSHFDRVTTGATLLGALENSGLPRRKVLLGTIGLMGAAFGAMILAHRERPVKRRGQGELVVERMKRYAELGEHPGPLPTPGVFARHNAVDTPALLPDGTVSDRSVSATLRARGVILDSHDLVKPIDRTVEALGPETTDADEEGRP